MTEKGFNDMMAERAKNHMHQTPEHYRLEPEPIKVIQAWGLDFCLGNVVKYIARAGRKEGESKDKDLHKAMNYLRLALEDIHADSVKKAKKEN